MSVKGFVLAGRRHAEALMVDTCTVRPVTGHTTNPSTGVVTPTYGAAVYTGRCKIQNQRSFPSNPDAGEHQWTVTPNFIHIPASAAAVDTGQVLEITAAFDPQNVGRKFHIKSGDRKSLQTAIRLIVDEVVN